MSDRIGGLRRAGRRLRPRSIRARVTVGASAAVAVALAFGVVLTIILVHRTLVTELRDDAAQAARLVADEIVHERYPGAIPTAGLVLRLQVVERGTGEVLAASSALQGRPAMAREDDDSPDFQVETTACGTAIGTAPGECVLVVGYEIDDTAYGDVLVLAATRPPAVLDTLLPEVAFVGLGLGLLACTAAIIWFGVGRALRPVREITEEIHRITRSGVSGRLPVPCTQDEIAELARTANAGLDRLEEAVTRQRRFVSDASHELRNPITGMHTKLEVELSDPEPDTRSRELLLSSLLADTERLEHIVADLLELARLDTTTARERERVDLSSLVSTEFGSGGRRARHALRVHTSGPVWVRGNRLQLVRVLTNLIANAERHAHSRVDVIVEREGDAAVVEVHDDGAGIPEEERERVFERFARLAESKERDPGGSGLGLPISREIAKAHSGTLVAGHSDLLGGAMFTLRIPDAPRTAE
ncbi:sensor histidine kinase [Nocardiopsis aegyptia]|uniref:histidine kinase n=1 Tax=Nocardiopsis aegyptia TaxID=220378 RepID=A0A7Z0ESR5_9ACTN|nr:HAMP domain-containing sensor histidine kinase [Nocardiopsis aegyptia]NYJ37613.1 signal transduction histidine kinase [Nocardiopsis aegyptia]